MTKDRSRLKIKTWWYPWLESWSRRQGHTGPDSDDAVELKGKKGIALVLEQSEQPNVVTVCFTASDLIDDEQTSLGWVYANEWNLQHSMPTISVDTDGSLVRMRTMATLPSEAKMFQVQFDQYLTKMTRESKRAFRWVEEACQDSNS